jgi:hypothetical protein
MTSHRWKHKWQHSPSAPVLHGALDDGRDIGDATAADADCHSHAGPKPSRESAVLELLARFAADIAEAKVGEVLAGDEQSRRKHQASSARPTLSFIKNQ